MALTYKGYVASLTVDVEAGLIVGKVLGLADLVSFQCTNTHEIASEFHKAVDTYLQQCIESGKTPYKQCKGKIPLRISPELHRAIHVQAVLGGKSINSYVEEILTNNVDVEA